MSLSNGIAPPHTVAEIAAFLRKRFEPDEVIELRIPKVDGKEKNTKSFFRKARDAAGLVKDAGKFHGRAKGIYVTLNPVRLPLVSNKRSANDTDIAGRHTFLVDCDPIRDADVSATDEEKARAREVATAIRDALRARGFPEPIVIDSGNGYHLLYRIDLPADDEVGTGGKKKTDGPSTILVKAVLEALNYQFGTDAVDVDTSVYNASRIAKLPGTLAAKGEPTEERPHRYSSILETPESWDVVPVEMLTALVAEWSPPPDPAPEPAPTPTTNGREPRPGEWGPIDRFLAYLKKIPPAISGQKGHNRLFYTCCKAVGFGLSHDEIFRLIKQHYNPTCQPPWSDEEITHKVTDALEQAERGALLNAPRNGASHQHPGPRAYATDEASASAPPPLDLAAIRARLAPHIAHKDAAAILRDVPLLADLARVRATSPTEYAAVVADLKRAKIAGFNGRDFTTAVQEHGPKKKPTDDAGLFFAKDGRLWTYGEEGPQPLTNFDVRIVEQVVRDDGDGQSTRFRVEGVNVDGDRLAADIAAEEFEGMGWIVPRFGVRGIINPGRSTRDMARAAIQELSAGVIRRVVFTHTGWRQVDTRYFYLHARGAIGPGGLDTSIFVDLSEHGLDQFALPAPPEGEELRRAVRASLGILNIGQEGRPRSRAVAAITIALAYRAALGTTNFAGQFNGPTGSHKSCLAALCQQHFGAAMNYRALPAGWNSTANALQAVRHAVKDALLVVDDFVPGGSQREREQANRTAEEVFRSQGNRQGRRRMGPDGKLRAAMDPRGSLLSTGEDRPSRPSANARTLAIWFDKEDAGRGAVGTIDKKVLTTCQADADAGLYAASMAAFVRWVAPRYEAIRDALPVKALALRKDVTKEGDHGRTPDIVADLLAGFDVFLEFAEESGAISSAESWNHREAVKAGLMEAADEMRADQQETVDAAALFVQLIGAAMTSNQAYLVDSKTGDDPAGIQSACGWRIELKWQGNNVGQTPFWDTAPNATRIGWTDGNLVYLDPDLSYNTAQRILREQGETLPAPASLYRLLNSGKYLVRTGLDKDGQGRIAARVSLEKRQRSVLVLNASSFWGAVTPDTAATPDGPPVPAEANDGEAP